MKKEGRKKESSGKILKFHFEDNNLARNLFGAEDQHLRSLEKRLGIAINVRGTQVQMEGAEEGISLASKLLHELYGLLKKGYPVFGSDIESALKLLASNKNVHLEELFCDTIFIPARNKVIMPKGLHQKEYIEAISRNDLVFGIGPAGTGKTYLAVAMGVTSLLKKEVDRIILARPAVEAGEKLGFLPGDIAEKVNPYLRPLYDALYEMLAHDRVEDFLESGVIEIAPLAFMRGRTLSHSFVILDEAQNCTSEQMKMFLTRLGMNSKAVVTGDITQIDLPAGRLSGLVEVETLLKEVSGIAFQFFSEEDVVRHRLVSDILKAYERVESVRPRKL